MANQEIKISALSANNNLNQQNAYFVMLDTGNTTQSVSGSTMKAPGSALSTMVWSNSSHYGLDSLSDITNVVQTYSGNTNLIRNDIWGYPNDAVRMTPYEWGQAIMMASSSDAIIRWHVRETAYGNTNILGVVNIITDGATYVTYSIASQEYPLPTGYHYYVYTDNSDYSGYLYATDSSLDTITIQYSSAPPSEFYGSGYISAPSLYNQVQAQSNGVVVKVANWTEDPTYSYNWYFDTEGNFRLPQYGSILDNNNKPVGRRTSYRLNTMYSSDTVSVDASSYDEFVLALSGANLSATILPPSNAYDSQIIMWNIRYMFNADAIILDSAFRVPMTTLNWSLSAGRMDIFAAKYNGPDNMWDVISFAPGYIIF